MKRWVSIFVALTACGPVVSITETDDGSTGQAGSTGSLPTPQPNPPMPTTAPPPPVTTGVDPASTGDVPEPPPPLGSSGGLSSSGSGSTSTDGSSSSGVLFIDPTGDPVEACDPYLQDCAEGEKCNAYAQFGRGSWDALGCFPVDPNPGQAGDACTVEDSASSGFDSCDVGTMCWDVDTETLEGTCVAMCEGSAEMPYCDDPATACIISNGGVLNLCLPTCDPLLQDCPAGQGCYALGDLFACAPSAPSAGGPGQSCDFINACVPGLACISADVYGPSCAGGTGCCSPFCDVTMPGMCPAPDQECVPWFDEGELPPEFTDIGVCSVPG